MNGATGNGRGASGGGDVDVLRDLLHELPDELGTLVFTHASWTERRSESYERLAFLGDSVLALSVSAHLYPRLDAERFGAGQLTKIRAQVVSGRSCRRVAERARSVRIETGAIPTYAASLPLGPVPLPGDRPGKRGREHAAAFWLTLNAINFGTDPLRRRELDTLTEILRRLRVAAGEFDEP